MRVLGRVLLSRWVIGLLLLILVPPLILAVVEIWPHLFHVPDLHEDQDIVTGLGVIMIGVGVALEERHVLREVFGLLEGPHEAWEQMVDHVCHKYGAGQLVLGLFAEICIEMIKIPNTIIYTGEVDDYLIIGAMVFMTIGAILLARGGITLLFLLPGRDAALPPAAAPKRHGAH